MIVRYLVLLGITIAQAADPHGIPQLALPAPEAADLLPDRGAAIGPSQAAQDAYQYLDYFNERIETVVEDTAREIAITAAERAAPLGLPPEIARTIAQTAVNASINGRPVLAAAQTAANNKAREMMVDATAAPIANGIMKNVHQADIFVPAAARAAVREHLLAQPLAVIQAAANQAAIDNGANAIQADLVGNAINIVPIVIALTPDQVRAMIAAAHAVVNAPLGAVDAVVAEFKRLETAAQRAAELAANAAALGAGVTAAQAQIIVQELIIKTSTKEIAALATVAPGTARPVALNFANFGTTEAEVAQSAGAAPAQAGRIANAIRAAQIALILPLPNLAILSAAGQRGGATRAEANAIAAAVANGKLPHNIPLYTNRADGLIDRTSLSFNTLAATGAPLDALLDASIIYEQGISDGAKNFYNGAVAGRGNIAGHENDLPDEILRPTRADVIKTWLDSVLLNPANGAINFRQSLNLQELHDALQEIQDQGIALNTLTAQFFLYKTRAWNIPAAFTEDILAITLSQKISAGIETTIAGFQADLIAHINDLADLNLGAAPGVAIPLPLEVGRLRALFAAPVVVGVPAALQQQVDFLTNWIAKGLLQDSQPNQYYLNQAIELSQRYARNIAMDINDTNPPSPPTAGVGIIPPLATAAEAQRQVDFLNNWLAKDLLDDGAQGVPHFVGVANALSLRYVNGAIGIDDYE